MEKDKFRALEDWLISNGGKFPKLELKDYGDEVRGCHSTQPISAEEIVVEIPLRCLITVEMGKETQIGQLVLRSDLDLDAPKHIYLMLFMLIDRRDPASFFRPYYDVLPKTLSNMPIFWSEEELSLLRGSFILAQIDERNAAIEADYAMICAIAPHFAQVASLDEFKWARMAVCSRNFGIIVRGLRTAALVPYADMLNHLRPRETKWNFDDAMDSFVVSAIHAISPGGQVFDSYGQKCNHRFLLNYGFSVENNEESDGFNPNEVPLLFALSEDDPLFELKAPVWRSDGGGLTRRVRVNLSDGESNRLAFSLLRIQAADAADMESIASPSASSSVSRYRGAFPAMLSSRNERAALLALRDMCEDYLSRYPTSLEQDLARLASPELPQYSNQRNAVLQVKGEKVILVALKRLVAAGLQLLSLVTLQERDAHLASVHRVEHQYAAEYCEMLASRVWMKDFDSRSLVADLI